MFARRLFSLSLIAVLLADLALAMVAEPTFLPYRSSRSIFMTEALAGLAGHHTRPAISEDVAVRDNQMTTEVVREGISRPATAYGRRKFLAALAIVAATPSALANRLVRAAAPQAEIDILKFAGDLGRATFDSARLTALRNIQEQLGIIIVDQLIISAEARMTIITILVDVLVNAPFDTVRIEDAKVASQTLHAKFFDGLPTDFRDAQLVRIDRVGENNNSVGRAAQALAADIRANNSRYEVPQAPPRKPSKPGVFDKSKPISILTSDLEAAKQRYQAGDSWTVTHVNESIQKANAAPALNAIPDTFAFTQTTADRWSQVGIALATSWRFTGNLEHRDKAKKIFLAMVNGFNPNEGYILANNSLDFSVAVPNYIYLYELLYGEFSAEEGQKAADVFSFIAERLYEFRYGGPRDFSASGNSPDAPIRKEQHDNSNIRMWQNNAMLQAALASRRLDLIPLIIGTDDSSLNDGTLLSQLRNAFDADHIIKEGSLHYQVYGAVPLGLAAIAAKNAGVGDLFGYQDQRLRKILQALLGIARADLTIPNTGDGSADDLAEFARVFGLANSSYNDPQFNWLLARQKPESGYRSWTALAGELRAFFAPGPEQQPPTPGPVSYLQAGFVLFRQALDVLAPGLSTLFLAQNHVQSHQAANQLHVGLWRGARRLSDTILRGFREYEPDANNVHWARSRAWNILQLDGNPPRGSTSFEPNGAKATVDFVSEYASPDTAVKVTRGSMTGGYTGKDESTGRTVFQIGAPNDPNSYTVVMSNMWAGPGEKTRTSGEIWHGPVGARPEMASIGFASTDPSNKDPLKPFYAPGSFKQATQVPGDWTIDWGIGETSEGLKIHISGLPNQTANLAIGPDNAPYLYVENSFEPGQAVDFETSVLLEAYTNGPQLRTEPLVRSGSTRGDTVYGLGFRDWIIRSKDPSNPVEVKSSTDEGESVVFTGPSGYVRRSEKVIDLHGDVLSGRIKASGIEKVRLNGQEIPFTQDGDNVVFTKEAPASLLMRRVPTSVKNLMLAAGILAGSLYFYGGMLTRSDHFEMSFLPDLPRLAIAAGLSLLGKWIYQRYKDRIKLHAEAFLTAV